jgi:hypothetical protein
MELLLLTVATLAAVGLLANVVGVDSRCGFDDEQPRAI